MKVDSDLKVLFLHIPKTAGTSLRGFLEGLYPESRCHKGWFTDSLLMCPPWEVAEKYFIAGHYPASILGWLPHKNYRIITFLREPIARTLSHFNHLKTESEAFMHSVAYGSDLDTFLNRDDGLFELANMQTRYLGALDMDSEYFVDRYNISKADAETWINGPRIKEAFRRAVAFLEKCDVVGIVEQMQNSMQLLSSKLCLSNQGSIGYANRGKLKGCPLSDRTLDALRKINEFDLKLYDEAKRILANRIAVLTRDQIDDSYRKHFASLPTLKSWHFTPSDASFSYGWHGRELNDNGGWARWTAATNAFIDIPKLVPAKEYVISFRIGFYTLQQMEGFRFTVDGVRIPLQSIRCNEISETQRIYRCYISGSMIKDCNDYIRLGWEVDTLVNPSQTFDEIDNRDLGVYLWWCWIENGNSLFR